MVSPHARARSLDRLVDLAVAGLDVEAFWRAATGELERMLDFDWRPCWFTLDPGSLVITSHFNEEIEELDPEVFQNEYVDDDVNKMAELGVQPNAVGTLERATSGDRTRSRRYRDLLSAYGMGQELVATLHATGLCWAGVTLYRAEGKPDFSDDDLQFVRAAAPALAEGARRGLLVAEASDVGSIEHDDRAPAVILIDERLAIVSMTWAAESWLGRLGAHPGALPAVVRAVASAVLERHERAADPPFARARTKAGDWAFVHGSRLNGGEGPVAVIIEAASPDRLGPLLMDAYGLSEREQQITRSVLRGLSTAEIAQDLFLSPWTVQDHLKGIFAKTGVRSRRQLLATVFFEHFEPRVRNNEQRVLRGLTIRGGPFPAGRATSRSAETVTKEPATP